MSFYGQLPRSLSFVLYNIGVVFLVADENKSKDEVFALLSMRVSKRPIFIDINQTILYNHYMITEEIDWLYWNRDRVAEYDFWQWVDSKSDQEIAELGEYWLRNLDRNNTVGHLHHLVASITGDWRYQHISMTPRQRRAVATAVRETWNQLRVGSVA